MSDPIHHFGHRSGLGARRNGRSVDHDDCQPKGAGGHDLGIGPRPPCIFGNHKINAVISHQSEIVFDREWPARDQHMVVGKRRNGCRCIDQSQQIKMLRIGREFLQMHTPHGQHDAARGLIKRGNRPCDVRHMGPVVLRLCVPRRSGQSHQIDIRLGASGHGIAAHLSRKGMGGVNHMGDLVCAQIRHQPGDASEPTDTLRQGLALGPFDATRKTHSSAQTRLSRRFGKGCGFGRAPKDQEVRLHV